MQISDKKVVSIHYTLKNEENAILDSSEGQSPLVYLQGANNIVSGLENALTGKQVGDKVEVSVSPEEGYGESREELVQKVPHDNFKGIDSEIQVGMQFMAQAPWGEQPVTVMAIEDEGITLDGNHPLAGQTLHFSVEVVDIRDASDEEVQHGHVHGEGGHHH